MTHTTPWNYPKYIAIELFWWRILLILRYHNSERHLRKVSVWCKGWHHPGFNWFGETTSHEPIALVHTSPCTPTPLSTRSFYCEIGKQNVISVHPLWVWIYPVALCCLFPFLQDIWTICNSNCSVCPHWHHLAVPKLPPEEHIPRPLSKHLHPSLPLCFFWSRRLRACPNLQWPPQKSWYSANKCTPCHFSCDAICHPGIHDEDLPALVLQQRCRHW